VEKQVTVLMSYRHLRTMLCSQCCKLCHRISEDDENGGGCSPLEYLKRAKKRTEPIVKKNVFIIKQSYVSWCLPCK